MIPNPLKNIPSVNELLQSPPLAKLVDRLSRNVVVSTVRTVLDEARVEVQAAAAERTLPSVSELAERIVRRISEGDPHGPRAVVNATGVLLHSELGSPPLADRAVEEMAAVAANYTAAEADPTAAAEGILEGLLGELTGAEAATVVQSGAAATMLTLAALVAPREVVVSRAHLIETEPGCRVADLISAAGAVLREVGTANITRVEDYTGAIGERTAALMMVHPGDFLMAGSTAGVTLEELVDVGRPHKLPVILLAPFAALIDCSPFGLTDQPIVSEAVKAGADVVLLQGDKLLGGPRSGIVVGRRALVDQIARHPIRRAFDPDKPTAAALAATLGLYRDPDQARQAIPLLRLLSTSADNLQNRAERLAPQIAATSAVAKAEPQTGLAHLCPQPIATHQLPTCRIVIEPAEMSADRLAEALRSGNPSVVGRVEQNRLILDLRSVLPRQDIDLTTAFESLDSEQPA